MRSGFPMMSDFVPPFFGLPVLLHCSVFPNGRISVDSTLSDTPHVASLNYSLRPHPKNQNSQETFFLLSSVSFPLFQLRFAYTDRRLTDRILLSGCPILTPPSVRYLSGICQFALAAWQRRSDEIAGPFSRLTDEKHSSRQSGFFEKFHCVPLSPCGFN
jgi:hypothetical protein